MKNLTEIEIKKIKNNEDVETLETGSYGRNGYTIIKPETVTLDLNKIKEAEANRNLINNLLGK